MCRWVRRTQESCRTYWSKWGTQVERGQALFRIDDRQLSSELSVREAALSLNDSNLRRLLRMRKDELPVAQARIKKARALHELEAERLANVTGDAQARLVSREEAKQRRQLFEASRAELDLAEASLHALESDGWKGEVAYAEAQVALARTQVAAARTEIDRLTVRSPITGQVLQLNVRAGEFVNSSSGASAPVIVGDTRTLHVRVDIDEVETPRFSRTTRGVAYARGDTTSAFKLSFLRVEPFLVPKRSLTGASSERVDTRVLQVVYMLDAQAKNVFVGQQLDVFIETLR